jgi:hypothetical protein
VGVNIWEGHFKQARVCVTNPALYGGNLESLSDKNENEVPGMLVDCPSSGSSSCPDRGWVRCFVLSKAGLFRMLRYRIVIVPDHPQLKRQGLAPWQRRSIATPLGEMTSCDFFCPCASKTSTKPETHPFNSCLGVDDHFRHVSGAQTRRDSMEK